MSAAAVQKVAEVRKIVARIESTCPQCKRTLAVGSTIAIGTDRNAAGGRAHDVWCCVPCAEYRSATYNHSPFIGERAQEVWNAHCAQERAKWEARVAEIGGRA
jgi:RNase P subunit RPR2